ncbi:MAG TPA: hypothetical protein VD861_16440 [Pyrinomonadaceae bacterium]|nr:hypothetical protein [Pyrinomonadaceae bacterium]
MYAGFEGACRPGGELERARPWFSGKTRCGTTALSRAAGGGEKLKLPAGAVGDGSEQLRAQHNCAALTSGASAGAWAFSQQSVMPVIGHSFSPECAGIGVPASTPPTMARRRIAAVSHFAIFS